MRRLLVVGGVAVLLALPTTVASGRASRASALVAYIYDGDLYVVRPDGSNGRRLTRTADFPTWSPDGRKIAFEVDHGFDTKSFIYTITASGRNKTKLLAVPGIGYGVPAWSPDGQRIAFSDYSVETFRGGGLYVVQTDGRGLHRIPRTVNGDTEPSWSPDGQLLAFSSVGANRLGSGGNGIALIGINGEHRRLITHGSHDYSPAFSPDGTKIAFSRGTAGGSESDIWVMNADGTRKHRLTDLGSFLPEYPAWAPDGRQIVFDTSTGSQSLYVMDRNGRHQQSIATTGASPDWQPHR